MSARSVLRSVHTWAGLTVGLVVALVGLTGSVLVYRADIERLQARALLETKSLSDAGRLSLDAIVARGAARIPEKEVVRVTLPHRDDEAVEVILQKKRARNLEDADLVGVFVDPRTGEVNGTRARGEGWLWLLQDFHYALFGGEPGLKINGAGAAVLLGLAFTGPILWWPGWARRASALRIRKRPAQSLWRDLHAVSGVIGCLVLALISVTALYYAYRSTATALVALASGSGGVAAPRIAAPAAASAAAAAAGTTATPRASLDRVLEVARAAVPQATWDEMRPSRSPTAPVSISFRLPDDAVTGRHRIYLDPRDARVLRIDRHDALPAGARVIANMGPWHFGSFGGRLTQALWFITGLMPAGLFATGLYLWLRRQRKRSVSA